MPSLRPPSLFTYSRYTFGSEQFFTWDGSRLWMALRDFRDPLFRDRVWTELLPPEPRAWGHLRKILEEIQDWTQAPADPNHLIMDGTGWNLEFRWDKRKRSLRGYEAQPEAFPRLERWMRRQEARIRPGIPGPFRVLDERTEACLRWEWDGRTLQWEGPRRGGAWAEPRTFEDLPPDPWAPLLEALRPDRPIDMAFTSGTWAGLSIAARLPGPPVPVDPDGPPNRGWLDVEGTLAALRALVGAPEAPSGAMPSRRPSPTVEHPESPPEAALDSHTQLPGYRLVMTGVFDLRTEVKSHRGTLLEILPGPRGWNPGKRLPYGYRNESYILLGDGTRFPWARSAWRKRDLRMLPEAPRARISPDFGRAYCWTRFNICTLAEVILDEHPDSFALDLDFERWQGRYENLDYLFRWEGVSPPEGGWELFFQDGLELCRRLVTLMGPEAIVIYGPFDGELEGRDVLLRWEPEDSP